jgi:dienelactone hydrolase
VVRRDGDVTVSRIDVPDSARSDSTGVPATEWRVSVSGRFPPRALRYEVLANGRPIAYGTPTADERSLRSVSTDSAVVTAHVTARYGDGSPPPVGSRPSALSPIERSPHLPNPGGFGPDPVRKVRYNFGDLVYQPPGLKGKVELTADVHYPRGLPDGPYPLVLFMHGNHSTCYKGRKASYEWPCRNGSQPIPNYAGYDYIAQRLASYGFIVVSVSANGVNVLGNHVRDTGMRQRGELLEKHIELWQTWGTIGGAPFQARFVGKVDLSRIGTMGHSRGGEGVVWNTIVDRERAHPFGIDAVLALAPVDFDRRTINNVPFAVVLPYCDGDVYDLEGIHYFDDSRYLVPGDATPKDTITVMGANHDFFNTVWSPSGGFPGAFDDGTNCPGRLSEAQQRHVGVAYIVGFFRRYLGGDRALDPMWTGAQNPSQIAPAQTLVSYLPPDTPQRRLDVDRFTEPVSLSRDALGAPVRPNDVSHYGWCLDAESDPCVPGEAAHSDVHLPGLPQGVIGWSSGGTGSVRFSLPPKDRDVSGFDAVQFRGALNPGYQANSGVGVQDLEVVLTDGSGHRKAVPASSVDDRALAYPPLRSEGHFILNQVRFPLSRFSGVRLKDVTSVELRFNRTPRGVIDLSDLAFVRGAG